MKHDFAFGVIPMFKQGSTIELLLIQKNEGHWGFPKGHPEVSETALETARRELLEETGIGECRVDEATTFEENYEVVWNGQKVPKTVVYFPGFVMSKAVSLQTLELKDFGWFSFEEALEKVTYEVTKKLLVEFKPYLAKVSRP